MVEEWMGDAACRGRDDVDWDSNVVSFEAKVICDSCPVLRECLTYALDREDRCDVGVWGATGPYERSKLRRLRGRGIRERAS